MNILFLCVANSARSQMAEGLARQMFGNTFYIQSAGVMRTQVHPVAIEVMAEIGIDIRNQSSKEIEAIDLDSVEIVVTLCAEQVCPRVSGQVKHFHWPLPDPSQASSLEEQRENFRVVRGMISKKLKQLASEVQAI